MQRYAHLAHDRPVIVRALNRRPVGSAGSYRHFQVLLLVGVQWREHEVGTISSVSEHGGQRAVVGDGRRWWYYCWW